MAAIDPESFVWASLGIEPPLKEDAIYEVGEQPIAGFDNYTNWAITTDLHDLNEWAGNHGHEHEAGGGQEIDLDGLGIGQAGQLSADGDEVRIDAADGTGLLRIDGPTDTVVGIPDFGVRTRHTAGVDLGGNLLRDGETIYDYGTDFFHRAEHALFADLAEDSNHLEGYTLQEILDMISGDIEDSFPAVEDSGVGKLAATRRFNFGQSIDVSTSGSKATMDVYSVPHAELSDLSEDSNHLEGYTVQEILAMVGDEFDPNTFPSVEDNGVQEVSAAETFNFGQSIDVDPAGSKATMSVTSVPHSQESEYAYNSNRLDGYHASDLIAMMGDGGQWKHIDTWTFDAGSEWILDLQLDDMDELFDRYKFVTTVENVNTSGHYALLFVRINADARNRYSIVKEVPNPWRFIDEQYNRFWTTVTDPGYANTSEMVVNCPPTVSNAVNSYPTFGEENSGGYTGQTGGHIIRGRLETDTPRINRLTFWPNRTAAATIELYGQDYKL